MDIKGFLKSEEAKKMIKFCITGGLNTVVDYAVFSLLSGLLSVNVYLAQFFGYAAGTLNSYIINRSWTFQAKDKFFSPAMIKFIVVNLISRSGGMGVMYLTFDLMHFNKYFAKLIVTGVTIVVNYIGSNFWVFKAKD